MCHCMLTDKKKKNTSYQYSTILALQRPLPSGFGDTLTASRLLALNKGVYNPLLPDTSLIPHNLSLAGRDFESDHNS